MRYQFKLMVALSIGAGWSLPACQFSAALPILVQTRDGKEFEFLPHDLDRLQSATFRAHFAFEALAGRVCRTPYTVPFDSPVVEALLKMVRTIPPSKRFAYARRLEPSVRLQLCELYDFLMCSGVFPDGLRDTAKIYIPVVLNGEFLANYRGQESGLLRAGRDQLPSVKPMLHETELAGHTDDISGLMYSHDGSLLVSTSWDRTVRIWNAHTDTLVHTLSGHKNWVLGSCLSHDGRLLASYDLDGIVCVWDVVSGLQRAVIQSQASQFGKVLFSRDDATLIISDEKNIIWWSVSDGVAVHQEPLVDRISDLVLSPDGTLLASCSNSYGGVRVFDAVTGALKYSWPCERSWQVVFSPDGRLIACHTGLSFMVWEVSSKRAVCDNQAKRLPFYEIDGVAFSHDSSQLLLWTTDGYIQAIDIATNKPHYTLTSPRTSVVYRDGFALSPDGRTAVWYYGDRPAKVRIIATASGQVLSTRTIKGTPSERQVSFHPTGGTIAFCSEKHAIVQADLGEQLTIQQLLLVLKAQHAPLLQNEEQQRALCAIWQTLPPSFQAYVLQRIEGII